MTIAILTFVVVIGCCVPLRADEDGAFCTGTGYVAYEARSGTTPAGPAGHVLRVLRFEAGRGIFSAGEVKLEDFHVHGMVCGAELVEISGWGRIFMKYTIDITGVREAEHC